MTSTLNPIDPIAVDFDDVCIICGALVEDHTLDDQIFCSRYQVAFDHEFTLLDGPDRPAFESTPTCSCGWVGDNVPTWDSDDGLDARHLAIATTRKKTDE